MKKPRPTIPWMQILLAGIVFIAVVWLALQSRDEWTEAVLVPLLYVLWLGELILKSFDQLCIWWLAVVITLVLSLFLTRRKNRSWWTQPSKFQLITQETGRIKFWRSQIRVGSSITAHSFRHAELRRLLINALAYRESKNKDEIFEQLHSGCLHVPPEVGYILGMGDPQSESDESPGFMLRVRQWLKRKIPRFSAPESSPDPRLEIIAQYIEYLLEVDNDSGNR